MRKQLKISQILDGQIIIQTIYVVHNHETTIQSHHPSDSKAIRRYGERLLCDQIRVYIDLLLRWNQKTSLTTVTDSTEILRFHFGESLLAPGPSPYGMVGSPTLAPVQASLPYQSVCFPKV